MCKKVRDERYWDQSVAVIPREVHIPRMAPVMHLTVREHSGD